MQVPNVNFVLKCLGFNFQSFSLIYHSEPSPSENRRSACELLTVTDR